MKPLILQYCNRKFPSWGVAKPGVFVATEGSPASKAIRRCIVISNLWEITYRHWNTLTIIILEKYESKRSLISFEMTKPLNLKLSHQFYQCPESPTKSTRMIAINDLINSQKSSFLIPLLRVFIRWYVQKISLWMEKRVSKTMYCNKVIVSGYSIERILRRQR